MTNKQLIHVSGTILINKDVATTFTFFANPGNDHLWRKEINKSTVAGTLQPGAVVSEYSYLSKKASNNLVELTCVEFDQNKLAVFETPANATFYQKSQRSVKAVSRDTTALTYQLDFDKSIVKMAMGFSLPGFIISWKANSDLKKYLLQLKRLLEQGRG